MKTDARVIHTKTALRDALFRCLREKPVKDITVKEVCDMADVNRATFYNHYRDCYDIVREIEQEALDGFRELLESKDRYGPELTDEVLEMIDSRKEINEAALAGMLSDSFRQKMYGMILEYALPDWERMMPGASEDEVSLALTVMISSAIDVAVNHAGKYDRNTAVNFITNMVSGCVRMYA